MKSLKKAKENRVNFADIFSRKQIGPNGRSKEWIEIANSPEMIQTFEEKGATQYFKKLRKKFEEKGFYKEFLK